MLASPGSPTDVGPDWAMEMKWDGQRCIARVAGGTVRLWARSGRDITASYPELAELADAVNGDAVLDGDVVALTKDGRPSFELLQPRMQVSRESEARSLAARRPVHLMLFDVLEVAGVPVTDEPYRHRREILSDLVRPSTRIQVPPAFEGDLDAAMQASRTWGLEGVVAKRPDGRYLPGRRSSGWVKLKHTESVEVVVGGWRPGQGGRAGSVGGLLLGVPTAEGGWRYVGRVGTGFSEKEARAWVERFAPLEIGEPPFDDVPALDARGAHWLRPEQVAEVEFGEWSAAGRLRHPRWRGWRTDLTVADLRAPDGER